MQIGRRIYYDLTNGNVILERESRSGGVNTSVQDDFNFYTSLSNKTPEMVGFIQLDYGQYDEDFSIKNGLHVDITGAAPTLVFSYPDPNAPEEPPVYRKPLSVEVEELRQRDMQMQGDITAIIEGLLGG